MFINDDAFDLGMYGIYGAHHHLARFDEEANSRWAAYYPSYFVF